MLPLRINCVLFMYGIVSLTLFFISGCDYGKTPEGVVVTVNGEPIELHSLQTLLDCRSSTMGIQPKPSLEEMRTNYVHAAKTLITHALVRQELRSQGIYIDDLTKEQLYRNLREDYGDNELEQYLKDSFIREDDWKQLIKDSIALETFKTRFLLPGIKIEKDEIQEYYEKNRESFKLPDMVKVCFLEANSEKELDNMCSNFDNKDNNIMKSSYCFNISVNDIPQEWQKVSKTIKLNICAKKKEEENVWRTIVIAERMKNHYASLGEVYALVENILLEQKQQAAFDKWLENKIKKARIYVSPELNDALGRTVSTSE